MHHRSPSLCPGKRIDKSTVSALRARLFITASVTLDGNGMLAKLPVIGDIKIYAQRSQRDDYIPYPRIEEVLERGGPYPQVILPQFGGYWIEETEEASTETGLGHGVPEEGGGGGGGGGSGGEGEGGGGGGEGDAYGYHLQEVNEAARAYRKHFLGKEHFNFTCTSCSHGNLLLSVKHEEVQEQEYLHVIQLLCEDPAGRFSPVLYPKDDYIPYPRIEEVLERGGPYPQVILPQFGGYWIEETEEASTETGLGHGVPEEGEGGVGGGGGSGGEVEGGGGGGGEGDAYGYHLQEVNEAARAYRKHFLGKEHFNFTCTSCSHGNLLLSVKHEEVQEQEYLHASQLIVNYDEHEVNNTFKFGVVYQQLGQGRTCCGSPSVYGSLVDTWNMISWPRCAVYTDWVPVWP
ncbi:hypothetical protein CRUP_016547 [Coryphaenoides rupestris]|nr:hypothetical protein CRUP_016547 [Coryphaenoides rupestris]